jgi:class 3 adenylate cyclase
MLPITASFIGSRQFGAGVVNLAARIEKLTSELGRTILASDEFTPLLVVPYAGRGI